jgi:hypothetical protein
MNHNLNAWPFHFGHISVKPWLNCLNVEPVYVELQSLSRDIIYKIHTVEGQEVGHLRIKKNWARIVYVRATLTLHPLWTTSVGY